MPTAKLPCEDINFQSLTQSVLHEQNKENFASSKEKLSDSSKNYSDNKENCRFSLHPASKFIGSSKIQKKLFNKFIYLLYHGLLYCVKILKGPTQEYLNRKSITLDQSRKYNSMPQLLNQKKFLMLDLDETLIHSIFDQKQRSDVKLTHDGTQYRFNVRPYCFQFLQNMSKHYQIYIFTASTKDYAEPIVEYLNKKKKTIQGILHRKNCMQTNNGFKIKDLRIIKNRSLKDIIIVDNMVHSFGLQLNNGIPILEFRQNKQDRQLQHLQKLLYQAKDHEDVREFIKQRINIMKCLEYSQKQFLDASEQIPNKENNEEIASKKQNQRKSDRVIEKKQRQIKDLRFTFRKLFLCIHE